MLSTSYDISIKDVCIYVICVKDHYTYLLLYVDDMVIASKDIQEIDQHKKELNYIFEMKGLGEEKKILGMEITRNRKTKSLKITYAVRP